MGAGEDDKAVREERDKDEKQAWDVWGSEGGIRVERRMIRELEN